jgi:hypothetical protein
MKRKPQRCIASSMKISLRAIEGRCGEMPSQRRDLQQQKGRSIKERPFFRQYLAAFKS